MQVWNFYFTPYYIFVKLLQSSVKYGSKQGTQKLSTRLSFG